MDYTLNAVSNQAAAVEAWIAAGSFLEALQELGRAQGIPWRGQMHFHIRFDPAQVLLSDGRETPGCDAAGVESARCILARAAANGREAGALTILRAAVEVCAGRHAQALEILAQQEKPGRWAAWVPLWRFRARTRGNFMTGPTAAMLEGIDDLDQAVTADPDNVHALAWRGRALKGLDQLTTALEDFSRAVALASGYHWVRLARANVRAELGDAGGALDDCSYVLERCGQAPWAWAMQARIKARSLGVRACIADLDRALELDSSYGALYAWRGEAKRQAGDWTGAERDLRAALRSNPPSPLAFLWLGRLCMKRGREEEARRLLDSAVERMPGYNLARAYRWQLKLAAGRFEEALEDFLRMAPLRPDQVWTPRWEDSGALRRSLKPLLERHARDAWAHAWAGKLLALMPDTDPWTALSHLDRALQIQARHGWAALWRGEVLYRFQGGSKALPDFERAAEWAPSAQSLGWLGRARLDLGHAERAVALFGQALQMDPDDNRVRAWRGEALARLGRCQQALADLTEIRARVLNAPEPFYWRAQALERSGHAQEALSSVEQALERRPGFWQAQLLKARVLKGMGNLSQARGELLRAGDIRSCAGFSGARG